ncbi:MAG TPA: PKD domain-containing protein [Chitinophagaceae bacterium]|nr:PKD domain-containing protein [Chitinophagaceae bacterium]
MKTLRYYAYCLLSLLLYCSPVSAQVADFTASPPSGCTSFEVEFSSTGTGTVIDYTWNISDGRVMKGPKPKATFTSSGAYTVTLTVTGSSGSKSSKSMVVNAYASPTVSFTAIPARICPCEEVRFTNTSVANAPGAYTSIWSFGDGNTATTNNTAYRYCTPGTYNVALKVTNSAGCYASKVEYAKVTVVERPLAVIDASKTSVCKLPDTVWFTGSSAKGSAPFSYSWSFGDGGTGTGPNPYHIYTTAGKYTVKLIISDAYGCKDTLIKPDYITAAQMNASFTIPATVCQGVSLVRFENTSVPETKKTIWSWSDGETSSSLHAQRYFWKAGTFTVTMIDSFGPGCKDTFSGTYTVHPKPRTNFSYWPVYPCPAPVDVHFENRTSGADSFFWIFGDGTTSRIKDPVHTYTRDSIFTVFMIAKSKYGCLDTFRVRDTSKPFPAGYPNPIYDSTNSPIIVRVYQGNILIKPTVYSGCIPLSIGFGAQLKSITRMPSAIDTTRPFPLCSGLPGYIFRPYWLCTAYPYPDPYPDEFYDPIPDYKNFPYPYPARTYFWDFGDGATSTDAAPTHIFTTEGEKVVKCTITTDSCSFTDSLIVQAGNKPTANFSFYPDSICKNDFVHVTNLSSGGLKYIWDWADGFTDIDTSKFLFHKYRVWGSRRILLTAERFGCTDTISKLLVINPPNSYFGMRYSCDTPLKVSFLDSSTRATRVFWIFGDGDTSSERNPVHTYAVAGSYTVRLATANDSFSCVDTSERTIRLFHRNPGFTAKNTCLKDSTILTTDIPDYVYKYYWQTAELVEYDTMRKKSFVLYKDTGTYSITLYYTDIHQCFDSVVKKEYITVAKPYVKFAASPLKSCAPTNVYFTDNSTNTKKASNISRTWRWGDATSTVGASGTTASHPYPVAGNYKVRLIVTDNIGCKDSAEIDIQSRKPVANFTAEANDTTCLYRNIKFHSISSGGSLSYQWYFGDGGTATGADPVYAYRSLGTFDVKLVVTDDIGCKDSIVKPAFITTTKPRASFILSDTLALCPPLFVKFSNTSSGAIRYNWDFDNGSTSTLVNPVAPFLDPKVYRIQLVAHDKFGCTDTSYGKARVAGYAGGMKYTPLSGCVPLTVSFEAEFTNVAVMIWDFADGITENSAGKPRTSHTYTTPGAYIPRLILGDGAGCNTASVGIDTIKVDDVEAQINTSPKCVGEEIVFYDVSRSYFSSYQGSEWTFHDGSTSTDRNPRRTYNKTGTYAVSLISENTNGCKDTLHTSITINPLPVIKANDTVICMNDSAVLSATGGVSYKWAPSPTLSCTDCNTPTTTTTVPAMYFVTGTDANGCKNRDTLSVGIKTKTTLILAAAAEVCESTPIQLLASGAQKYSWSPDSFLNNAYIPNPVATMKHSIVYRVIGTEGSCIPDTALINVTVHPTPEVNAGSDQTVLAGTEVQLGGPGKYTKNYLWTPDSLLSCSTCPNPVVRPAATTTFTLKGTSDFGCSDSDDVIITIFCDQSQLFIPNTFTPNGDGQNDVFYPQGKGVSRISSFIIYNRWGQKIFERNGINVNAREQGWDGSFNGSSLGPDTFVYTLEAICDNGETVFWKGDVTLIK